MSFLDVNYLSVLVFFPLVWAIAGTLVPTGTQAGKNLPKYWALAGTLILFFLSIPLVQNYDPAGSEFQWMELHTWIPSMGVSYHVGVDGLSLWLILLTTLLMPLAVLASFQSVKKDESKYYFLLLMLETGMLGAFLSLDIFLFYVFWEVMLIPMYFLIGIWGGKERTYAATKFFLYTMVGSLLMLVAIFYLVYLHKVQFGEYSGSIVDLYRVQMDGKGWFSTQAIMFLAFSLAFAIKVPLFPFHTWLPDAHVQAPTAGSVILAGVLLKMGGYGFLRFAFPLFPAAVAQYQMIFLGLGAIAIVYGALVAMVQPDMKKLVAYSSVSHMGYIVLGLFSLNAVGVSGSIYQMLNHGVSTGGLFLLVGMIYDRAHTREIDKFGGITKVMPLFAVAFLIVTLSSIAVPGTNGFVGEFMILLGTWKASPIIAGVAGLGVIFGAVYMLWMFQRVMFGPIKNEANKSLKDLNLREVIILVPILLLIVGMGLFPGYFFAKMEPSVTRFLSRCTASSNVLQPSAFSFNRSGVNE